MTPGQLPIVSSRAVISVLERLGFSARQTSGTSHVRYVHPDGRKTTVSIHKGRDIGRGLLRKILRDIEMTPEEFKRYL